MGGPYSSREDAEDAISHGSFDQDPAELEVVLDTDDEGDDGGDEAQTAQAMRRQAEVPQQPGGPNPMPEPNPYATPQTPATPGPATPDVQPLVQPMPDGAVPTRTTKPSQTPGGGADSLPEEWDPSFDYAAGETSSSAEPENLNSAAKLASLEVLIRQENPGADAESIHRVARQVLAYGDLFQTQIEDPMEGRDPIKRLKQMYRNVQTITQHPMVQTPGEWAEKSVKTPVRQVTTPVVEKTRKYVTEPVKRKLSETFPLDAGEDIWDDEDDEEINPQTVT